MLTPEYLNYCADDIVDLYAKLDESIARDVTRRIIKTGGIVGDTAKLQIQIAQESGLLYDDIVDAVADIAGASRSTVKAIFEDAGVESLSFDSKLYEVTGKSPGPLSMSPSMLQILKAGIAKTSGEIKNLTKTTALSAQRAYIDACTLAELQVSSGAFNYNTAIRYAVHDAIKEGATVTYPSGHVDKLDVAVRRSVLTGVSQTTGEISLANARDMGTDVMEITAHAGARPSHTVWQGQLVCISGKKSDYWTVEGIGYGTGAGFKGWNCRHDWFPFLEEYSTRAYTNSQLSALNDQKVRVGDTDIPTYEATQMQRALERQMRETRRIMAGLDEAAGAADDEALRTELKMDFFEQAQKLKKQREHYKDFCRSTGLPTDFARTQKHGYNRSVSGKSVWANRKIAAYDALIGTKTPLGASVRGISAGAKAKALANGISPSDLYDALQTPQGYPTYQTPHQPSYQQPTMPSNGGLKCPRCGSPNPQVISETQGKIKRRGCFSILFHIFMTIITCGLWIIIPLLRGGSKGKIKTTSYWVCNNCGNRWKV